MNVLHLLASGGTGGIETLCKDYAQYSQNNNLFVIVWKSGIISEEMKENKAKVIEINSSKRNFFKTIKQLFNICERNDIHVVVVHHASPILHLYMIAIKRKFDNIQRVAYAHGNAEDMCRAQERGYLFRKAVLRHSINHADVVVAISNSVKKSLVEGFHTPKSNITVIYNGVDINKFTYSQKEIKRTVEIIYVGRLIEEKGVQIVLKGLARLPSTFLYRFRIVGDGNYHTELEKCVQKLGIKDKVEFLGNTREVPTLLGTSDIFVHMPIWEEGFGITIVEALATGLICICADAGAIPEIIKNGKNGFLVNKNDSVELANVIRKIPEIKKEKLKNIKLDARNTAKEFSVEKFSMILDQIVLGENSE